MKLLNAKREMEAFSGETIKNEVIDKGRVVRLSNDWRFVNRRVSGETRFEIVGPNFIDNVTLKNMGAFTEIISFKTRYFIPLNGNTNNIIERLIQGYPVASFSNLNQDSSCQPR